MDCFNTEFANIGNQSGLRFGVFYRRFFDIQKAKVWDSSTIELKSFLRKISSEKVKKGHLEDAEILVDLANIERRYNNIIDAETVTEIGSDKTVIENGDIVIPKIQPRMGNIFTNTEHNRYIASSELVEYSCFKDVIHPKLLFYLLTHPTFQSALFNSESGKTHRRVNPSDLLLYRIPYLPSNIQLELISSIETIEQDIANLKTQILSFDEIVNEVFSRHIAIPEESILAEYKGDYTMPLSDMCSYDIRTSVRFNNPKYSFLSAPIFQHYIFADFIDAEKTTLGRQMSPDFIEEDSEVFYINTNSIKIGGFVDSVLTPISLNFYNKNSKLRVDKGDILLIASGEGSIGRSCIFDSEADCITSQFIMKIHPKESTDTIFLNFYMHSFYFQYCVEKFKKGKGNMTNIFVSQLLDFPLYYPSQEIRKSIVDEITSAFNYRNMKIQQINTLRCAIDNLLTKILQSPSIDTTPK